MSYAAGVILASVAMAILIAMAQQAWTYWRGQHIISRRLFLLRLTNGVLLLATIGLIFYGSAHRFADLRMGLLYLSTLSILPVVVIILAWLDLRELRRTKHERQAELYRSLAQLEQELRSKPPHQE